MRTTSLMILGAAPGAVAVGYFLLTGYLLNRVRPLPSPPCPGSESSRSTMTPRIASSPRADRWWRHARRRIGWLLPAAVELSKHRRRDDRRRDAHEYHH